MSEHFTQLRKEKELIKMREALMSDWRNDLTEDKEEEHPYVDVMPSTDQKEKDAKKKQEEKKEDKEEKEEVKEGASLQKAGREFYRREKEEGSMDYESPRTKARKKAEAIAARKKLDLSKSVEEGYKPMPHAKEDKAKGKIDLGAHKRNKK